MFGRRRTPSARPSLLMFRIDRPKARISSSLVLYRVPRSGPIVIAWIISGVHLGLKKMYMGISRYYFWKRLYVDVANFVRQCKQCSETADIQSNANEVQKEQQIENSDNPIEDKTAGNRSTSKVWQKVGWYLTFDTFKTFMTFKVELKLFGPYPRTVLHNEFIVTIADPFSHWLVARPISDSNDANHIADFVYKTFCTFGFAKCSVVDIPQEVLEMIQSKYEECVSRLRDTLLTCGLVVPHLVSSCSTAVSSLHPLISENLSQCSWVGKLLSDFVEANHSSWDLELERFLFECCTTSNAESPSPFTIMFGRSPVSCLEEEDKENRVGKEKPVEVLSKRRRLQSSILQVSNTDFLWSRSLLLAIGCDPAGSGLTTDGLGDHKGVGHRLVETCRENSLCRHCEDVFTSKISFRIHQRKHTEEARRQGILEGQEPHESVTEREKKLLKRTIMKRRQKLLKQGNTDHRERLVMIANQKLHPGQESLPKDKRRAELQASTVAAVKKLLASTKEERRRRGRYHKYSAELQEEMARYATEHGNLETVRHFSQRMGTTVSESTVRNIVKLYRAFTPGLKEEIGRFAVRFGVEMACSHFTERLGQQVRRGLVRKFKKLYLSHHPDVEGKQTNTNKDRGTSSSTGTGNVKQKSMYTNELKDEIGSYACQFGIPMTVEHFAQKLSPPPKESTVRKFRKLYLDKHRGTQQVSLLQQQLQIAGNVTVQETAAPPSTQTIDILHASLNILNNAQINGPTTVVYNTPFQSATLPHIQSTNHIVPASHTASSVPLTFHPVNNGGGTGSTNLTYQQQTPITASVIMNQSGVTFNQNSVPLQTFHPSQSIYSSYNNQGHSENNTTVPLSHKTVTSVPLTLAQAQQSMPQVSATTHPHSAIPTITVAIASHNQQQFQQVSNNSVVVPHQSHTNGQGNLGSQQSILVSHEQNGTTVVQQLVASSLPHHLRQHQVQEPQQSQQTDLRQSLSDDIINSGLTNSASEHLVPSHSQVLMQQPSVMTDSLIVEQSAGIPNHSQMIGHQNLESPTFVHTLNSDASSLPFDTSGSTLIANRHGTYSTRASIKGDISVSIEKESHLETSETQDIPITIQTQETQTPRDSDDVVISVIPQEISERLKSDHIAQLSETEATSNTEARCYEQETKVIHVVKVDCSMEEDADDLSCTEEKPKKKKKNSTRGSTTKKKKSGSVIGQKRGNYTVYSPEIRAEMGKFAAEHGSQRACQYFKSVLGHDVPESTIRGLRDKYLLKREHCGSSPSGNKEVTSLGYAPRGRPMRLGKYDEVVQECIRELIKSGERVSSFLAIATAKQVLMQYEPELLEENGGKVKLNVTWAKSFLKRIGVQNNS
ncbi:hypothetical protein ANN_11903 [Periplaneta americana]|uniref:C2H2-type domain-containing protein n=1 Tax=Periplaneta americana TaxID=6978 RepID=A0ABQ8T864_PERAM|nr:hypothetical protein ANN_11903 [Periplaneta americana]